MLKLVWRLGFHVGGGCFVLGQAFLYMYIYIYTHTIGAPDFWKLPRRIARFPQESRLLSSGDGAGSIA